MRQWALVCVALVVGLAPVMAAASNQFDGKYAGTIQCDVIQGQTTRPLRTEFLLTIADGRATYERQVLQPDSSMTTGVTERGSGTVAASGEVVLAGSANGQGWKYDATYRGQIVGKDLRLTGTQQWSLSIGARTRPCTIALSRVG